ncbi:uncharacterized protein LOC132548282 [Ylistrum balloti]|uniref:uncharacterized protein LOC132548282 n=1 Tax=Ylistrum balloti TaxID=509963 RepID=UPI00290585C8|nr:uncharacterized protein LOC132548282 [Ylistrum balloti]
MGSTQYDNVVAVISKKPELRQDFEIQGLLPWLRKKSQLFSQLKTDYLKDIVRNCGMVSFDKEEMIIKQGDRGDCFYIILDGKISIFILNKDKDADDDDKAMEEIGKRTPEGKLDRSKLGNFVTHLGSGVPFGEVALMSDDCIRTASIISEEKTDLLVVDRALYNRAVKIVLAKEFEEKVEFIKSNPLFANWAPRYRKQLTMAMYKETFPYDSILVKQGEPVTNIYFVISGQVEIQIDPSHHQVQYPRIFMEAQNESDRLIRKHEKIRPPTEVQYSTFVKKKDSTKYSKLCILGINESIGEVEVLLDLPTYTQTAVCTEKTDVLVLEMKHYERLFVRRHPRTIESMRAMFKVKLDTRMNLLTNKEELPFLNLLKDRIDSYNNPKPSADKKKKELTSASAAEKEFLNHKGPLIDMYGPGSVFYMIRVREKHKQKYKAHKERGNFKKPVTNDNGHLHSVRVPHTLLMAAQMSGATRDSDALSERSEQTRILSSRIPSARSLPHRNARSFRRIQSATRATESEEKQQNEENEKNNDHVDDDDFELAKSLPDTRQATVMFPDTKEDMALTSLEERVREWLDKGSTSRGSPQVAQLRRLPMQELETQPKPGNKVILRRRVRLNDPPEIERTFHNGETTMAPTESIEHFKILIT